ASLTQRHEECRLLCDFCGRSRHERLHHDHMSHHLRGRPCSLARRRSPVFVGNAARGGFKLIPRVVEFIEEGGEVHKQWLTDALRRPVRKRGRVVKRVPPQKRGHTPAVLPVILWMFCRWEPK